jgi:hypothetical protein
MNKKIKITESQLERLKINIIEGTSYSDTVRKMKEELDMNYEANSKFVREGGEYFEKPMIKVKVDEEMITPKALYEYMKYKYKTNEEFTKQVIRDWVDGKITDDYRLSKNISHK